MNTPIWEILKMKLERSCKNCGSKFFAKKYKQLFCSRKCFKQDYFKKKKSEFDGKFPSFKCSKCLKNTNLNFDPVSDLHKWSQFKCPHCQYPDINLQIIISNEVFVVF